MNNTKKINRLQYITQDLEHISHARLAEDACLAGVKWVQLRVKNKPFNQWLSIAEETLAVCRKHGAKLIINDNVEIAAHIGADGVHLGKEDMDPEKARKILGGQCIIGGSTNTRADILRMNQTTVDYIGLGPFRFTQTRKNLNPVLGMEKLAELASLSIKPVVAIGGITVNDLESIIENKIFGVAVSSGINLASCRIDMAKKYLNKLNEINSLHISPLLWKGVNLS